MVCLPMLKSFHESLRVLRLTMLEQDQKINGLR